MNVWRIVCATLVIFVAGIATGVLLVRIGERGPKNPLRFQRDAINRSPTNVASPHGQPNQNPPIQSGPGGGGNGPLSREFAVVLERQLRLTPEQRDQVHKLLNEGQERIRELRQKIEPQVRQEMQRTHEQIQALLTAEQREQFQRLMKQRLQRRNDPGAAPERRGREPRESREPRPPQEFREPQNPPPPAGESNSEPRLP